jgi:hypothetical protein
VSWAAYDDAQVTSDLDLSLPCRDFTTNQPLTDYALDIRIGLDPLLRLTLGNCISLARSLRPVAILLLSRFVL